MWEAASDTRRKPPWASLLRDESGVGYAAFSAAIGLFAVQCVVGALVMSRQIDHIIHAIRAIL
jgi:hypothetical protein